MAKADFKTTTKAEFNVLKDVEKIIKWDHITLSSLERRYDAGELTKEEFEAVAEELKGSIIFHEDLELELFKRIARLVTGKKL